MRIAWIVLATIVNFRDGNGNAQQFRGFDGIIRLP
jgi:hypothetical protein